MCTQKQLAERLLLDKFQQEPFHNLYLLNDIVPTTTAYGGTCSDKTLSYLRAAKALGLDAHLHSARIGGKDIHRLIRLEIAGQRYFADVGNGWPSIELFPAETPIDYACYGMSYRTEIHDDIVTVYHRKRGIEKQQMEIDIASKPEKHIYQDIRHRFSAGMTYPFSHSLRFSMIVGGKFLFFRDTRLEIYGAEGYQDIFYDREKNDLKQMIMRYFSYDISPIYQNKKSQ